MLKKARQFEFQQINPVAIGAGFCYIYSRVINSKVKKDSS